MRFGVCEFRIHVLILLSSNFISPREIWIFTLCKIVIWIDFKVFMPNFPHPISCAITDTGRTFYSSEGSLFEILDREDSALALITTT